ncbi:MAG: ribosome biogenesis factor YjgA [Rubrivivax sp.]|jgi:ribosome-associated protein
MPRRAAPSRQPPSVPDEALGRASKSQLKRDATQLQKLGVELAAMPASRLAALNLPASLADALAELERTRSHEGRRRQLQFVGKLMRQVDAQPLQEAVALWKLGGAVDALQLHEAELWRERLLADDNAFTDFAARFPLVDLQQLRALVRQARAQAKAEDLPGQAPRQGRAFRELFRSLRAAMHGGSASPGPDDIPDEASDGQHLHVNRSLAHE